MTRYKNFSTSTAEDRADRENRKLRAKEQREYEARNSSTVVDATLMNQRSRDLAKLLGIKPNE